MNSALDIQPPPCFPPRSIFPGSVSILSAILPTTQVITRRTTRAQAQLQRVHSRKHRTCTSEHLLRARGAQSCKNNFVRGQCIRPSRVGRPRKSKDPVSTWAAKVNKMPLLDALTEVFLQFAANSMPATHKQVYRDTKREPLSRQSRDIYPETAHLCGIEI